MQLAPLTCTDSYAPCHDIQIGYTLSTEWNIMMTRKTSSQLVQDAKARIENLSVEEASKELTADNVLLVDIRESEERHQYGAIPGFMSVPRGLLEFWADPTNPMHRKQFQFDRRIILYCATGGRSALAADALRGMGFSRVAHIESGFAGWQRSGRSVERLDMWWMPGR